MKEKILNFFWYIIKILWIAFLVAGIPGIIYELAINISYEKGLGLVIIIYWIAILAIVKYRADVMRQKRQIKKLLNGNMDENEKSLLKKRLELEK